MCAHKIEWLLSYRLKYKELAVIEIWNFDVIEAPGVDRFPDDNTQTKKCQKIWKSWYLWSFCSETKYKNCYNWDATPTMYRWKKMNILKYQLRSSKSPGQFTNQVLFELFWTNLNQTKYLTYASPSSKSIDLNGNDWSSKQKKKLEKIAGETLSNRFFFLQNLKQVLSDASL
jgi:hypothetical protein